MSNEYNELNAEEQRVILEKGTERPFTGQYTDYSEAGLYVCKQCDAPLYRSEHKFHSHCGWPSFDDEITDAIKREVDSDGRRTEILCANCGGHLGHVFEGEGLTAKNIRHCVNSISMKFLNVDELENNTEQNEASDSATSELEKAYFAGGCFWGVEHLMQKQAGVVSVESGYMGGWVDNPTYQQVCTKTTGHLEVVEVSYNPQQVDFETLAKLFFEIHDPTQENGQGPDIGNQYLSAVFARNQQEVETIKQLISILEEKGLRIATEIKMADTFWKAEDYHQDYYEKNGHHPYCHHYQKRF